MHEVQRRRIYPHQRQEVQGRVCVCIQIETRPKTRLDFVDNHVFVDVLQQMCASVRVALRQPAPNALRMVPRFARRAQPKD